MAQHSTDLHQDLPLPSDYLWRALVRPTMYHAKRKESRFYMDVCTRTQPRDLDTRRCLVLVAFDGREQHIWHTMGAGGSILIELGLSTLAAPTGFFSYHLDPSRVWLGIRRLLHRTQIVLAKGQITSRKVERYWRKQMTDTTVVLKRCVPAG